MKKQSILLLYFLSLFTYADVLQLCQESASEDPFLQEIEINGQLYHGQHAAIVAHSLLQLNIEFSITRMPWKRCLSGAVNGVFDGAIGVGWSEERGRSFIFPMLDNHAVNDAFRLYYVNYPIYTLSDSPLLWDGVSFSNIKHGLAAPKGYIVEEKLRKMGVLQQTDVGVDIGVSLLRNKRIDGVVLSEDAAGRMIADEKMKDIKKLGIMFYRQAIFLAISNKQKKLSPDTIQSIWEHIPSSRNEIMATEN